ncbi:MAG: DUF2849 domain-containing protein [Myxococcales bacterium]
MGQVVIASRLSDGLVVFLRDKADPSGGAGNGRADWVLQLADAEVADDDSRAAELLALGEADGAAIQSVVDIYLIEVEEETGQLRPTKAREAIRCFGPTVRPDLGKLALAERALAAGN